MKKNIFDTQIEMIDLDSIGNMEVSYDETSAPNPELGNDIEMVMQETQVISEEDIQAAIEKQQSEIPEELVSGETRVIETPSPEDLYAGETKVIDTAQVNSDITFDTGAYDKIYETQAIGGVGDQFYDENEDLYAENTEEPANAAEPEYDVEPDEEVHEAEYSEEQQEAEYTEEGDNAEYTEEQEVVEESEGPQSDKLEEDESYDFENDVPKKKKEHKAVPAGKSDKHSKNSKNAKNAKNGKGAEGGKQNKKSGLKIGAIEIAALVGAIIILFGLGAIGIRSLYNKAQNKNIEQFASIGTLFSNIDGIGDEGIQAIGQKAYIDSITPDEEEKVEEQVEEEKEEEKEEEEELETVDPVSVNFSSIEKDLKIKFTNKKTGKLVTGVKFEVSAKGPKGTKFSWIDTDMDGVIYVDKLEPGNYEVKIINVDPYEFPDLATIVKVQDTVVYQVINVMDEAVDMSQVNLAQEENQVKDIDQGPAAQDTVSYVESTKTDNYVKIDKKDITDPKNIASKGIDGGFRKVSGITPSVSVSGSGEVTVGASTKYDATVTADPGADTTVSWSSSDESVATVDGSGNVTGVNPGTATIKASAVGTEGTATITVKPATVSLNAISVSGGGDVTVGGSIQLSVAYDPADATNKNINWTSSDNNIATVDGSGKVTGVAVGTVTITATGDGGKTATATVNVKAANVAVTGVTVNGGGDVAIGSSVQLTATVAPDNATNKAVTWSSSNTGVATVDASGKVTGVAAGSATITATTADGSKTATATVNVKAASVAVTGVTVSGGGNVAVGGSIQLTATVAPNNASNKAVTWSSSNTGVATVDGSGKVTGVAAGSATITATTADGGKTATATVTVTAANNLKLTVLGKDSKEVPSTLNLAVGETYQLTSKVEGASDTGVKYASSNNAATVDGNGKITAAVVGTADITVTTNAKDASGNSIVKKISVTVKADVTKDTTTLLKIKKDGKDYQVYYKNSEGKFVEAKYADYYTQSDFYILGDPKYTGWQTIGDSQYYYDSNGNKVTGEQVIQGVKYNFASDGALIKGSGSRGIDVSAYQGNIDWNAVKDSGISFVIIRCGFRGYTKGGLILDSKYKSYIQGATAAGLKVGLYIFSQATNEAEAVEEASLCVNLAQGYRISYPIFLDSEYSNGAHNGRADGLDKGTRTAVCKAFCETIKSAGYTPGVYASKSWFYNKLDYKQLEGYKIWLAHYCGETDYKGKYDIWQHSSKGSVNGIKGNVDLDISYLGY